MITAKIFIRQPKENLNIPPIPDNVREALKDVDNYVKFKVVLGVDAGEILTSEKPLLE